MKNRKIFLLALLLLVCILSISAITATENPSNQDGISADNNKETNLETNIQYDDVSNSKENVELKEEENNNDKVSESETEKTTADNAELTFTDLNTTINGNTNSTIYLSNNYKYKSTEYAFRTGIPINRNLTIYGNGVTINGNKEARIFNVEDNVNVQFHNINFINGNARSGGAIYNGNAYGCTFTGNYAGDVGGAIYQGNAYNSTFNQNKANYGGAIYQGNAYNCTFTENQADSILYGGGAIYQGNAYNSTFTRNNASIGGGAIYQGNAYNCTFTGNTVIDEEWSDSGYGGAIYQGNAYNSTFTKNKASQYGGAIYNGVANDCIFNYNTAEHGQAMYGGISAECIFNGNTNEGTIIWANNTKTFTDLNEIINGNDNETIYLTENYTFVDPIFVEGIIINRTLEIFGNGITIDGSNFARIFYVTANNVKFHDINFINANTTDNGGAILGGNAYNCTFSENKAKYGGAICNGTAYNCTFSENKAIWYGGAICNGTAYNSTFTRNNASFGGGAIRDGNATNCTFTENQANYGGAIYNGNAYNSTFNQNKAKYGGGAIYQGNATNCTFNQNTAPSGGAIYQGNATNCTFNQNNASLGGAIYQGNATNCKFTANTALDGGAIYNGTATNCIFYNNLAIRYGSAMYMGQSTLNIFVGNEYYNTTIITVYLNVLDYTSFYRSGEKLLFNVTSDNEVYNGVIITIKIIKDMQLIGTYYAYTGEGWIVNLDAGNYTAILTTDHPDILPVKAILNINKISAEINAPEVNTTYGIDKDLIITLKDSQGNPLTDEIISVNLNGEKTYTTDKNGQIKINVGNLTPNTYTAKINFAGNENYEASTINTKVTVKKATPKITATEVNTTYGINKDLIITLKDSQGNPLSDEIISVNLNGEKTYTTDKNGQIKINVGNLTPNTYTAKINFAGNKNYIASSINTKVTVNKATPKITANAITFKLKVKTKQYTVTLKNNLNQVMKNTKLSLKVNGKTYNVKTNSKGQAIFKITNLNKIAKYNAVITFAANNYYNKVTKNVKITVKK